MLEIPESIGPYRVLSKVGEGGMGVVYKAEDQRLGRVVALKVIREFDGDSSRRSRFWQEARAAAQVAHPNACRIYDIAEEQDCLVLVMEFIEGESLAQRLERGSLPAQEAGQIALALLSALEAFHKVGIAHRDLKPGNTVLSNGGTKLLDFGIAKHVPVNAAEEPWRPFRALLCREFFSAHRGMHPPNNSGAGPWTHAPISFRWARSCSRC